MTEQVTIKTVGLKGITFVDSPFTVSQELFFKSACPGEVWTVVYAGDSWLTEIVDTYKTKIAT